jgi:uroporphyrinogen decarboxylase
MASMAVPESVQRALAAKGDRKTDFERLKAALHLQEPDYVPLFEMGIEPEIKQQFMGRPLKGHADEIEFFRLAGYDVYPVSLSVVSVNVRPVEGTAPDSEKTTGVGVRTHTTSIYKAELEAYTERHWAEMHKGVITTKEEFAAYPWPDPDNLDFSVLDEVGALLPPGMKIGVVIGKVFTGVWFMMGMETFMLAYMDDPELIDMMYGKIVPLQQRVMEAAMDHPAVGCSFHADDLSGTNGPLVHPDHYRKYVFPCYKTMCDMAKAADKPFIYHSDGDISMIIEDLIGLGIDGWHPVEKQAHDINEIKAKYGDRIALLGNIDLQYTLTKGTPQEVDEEVRTRIHDLAPGGGYCVSSGNSVPEYVPIDNYAAMLEATFKYGKYPITVN